MRNEDPGFSCNLGEYVNPFLLAILRPNLCWHACQKISVERVEGGEDGFSMLNPKCAEFRVDLSEVYADPGSSQTIPAQVFPPTCQPELGLSTVAAVVPGD